MYIAHDTTGKDVAQSTWKFSCKSVFSANVLYSHTRPLRYRRGHSNQEAIQILSLAIS